MNHQRLLPLFFLLSIGLLFSNCGPGQFLGPTITPTFTHTPTQTITPSPTVTFTPTITPAPTRTPIPGIEAPIVINGIGMQIRTVTGQADPPAGYRHTSGYDTTLNVELVVSSVADSQTDVIMDPLDSLPADLRMLVGDISVVDEHGVETQIGMLSPNPAAGLFVLSYAVNKEAKSFSLHFKNGQTIDLTPLIQYGVSWVDGSVVFGGAPAANIKVELVLNHKTVLTTQTDEKGTFLFSNVPPNEYPESYDVTITLENTEMRCTVSALAMDVRSGWRATYNFIVDGSVFSEQEFVILDTGELAICRKK